MLLGIVGRLRGMGWGLALPLPIHDPASSLLQCVSTLLMLVTSDIYTLINYVGFINYLFYGVTVAGQVVLRWKAPNMPRPIKVKPRPHQY